jgi:hypothetical protein
MRENPSHPPRPGVRRLITSTYLETPEARRMFAASVYAIQQCGLAAEVIAENVGTNTEPRLNLYATRRTRTARGES